MKPLLLANENVPLPSVNVLRQAGYNVLAVGESCSGKSDLAVLDIAVVENRWIVTLDRDYGQLIFARKLPSPPGLLYLRLRSYRPETPGEILVDLLRDASSLEGQFVVVQEDALRKRPFPK